MGRRMLDSLFCLSVLSCALLASPPAAAGIIAFGYTGVVTSVDDPGHFFDNIPIGTAFNGYYAFQTSTPDSIGNASVGLYIDPLDALYVTAGPWPNVGGTYFPITRLSASSIEVSLGPSGDEYSLLATSDDSPAGYSPEEFSLNFIGTPGLLPNDSLPVTPAFSSSPDLLSGTFSFTLSDIFSPGVTFDGTVTGLTPIAVDEPTTLELLAAALVAFATGSAWRCRKRAVFGR